MSEENEQKDNGGITQDPAGKTEEYREGGRYSDHFRPEPAADETKKVSGDAGTEAAGESLSREGKSREEMERQFRDDPRFAMFFEESLATAHSTRIRKEFPVPERVGTKPEREWSIKVGGIRLTPIRILILSVFFLIILLCLGASVFYAVKDIGKYKDFSQASALYEAGDYENAKTVFVKVLSEDPNNEAALRMMADIYHHFGDWNNESFFRQRIMRLNPLDGDSFHAFLESAFRARNFGSMYSILNLKVMEDPDLPPDDGALFLISALNSGHVSVARDFCETMKKSYPDYFSDTERGRFGEIQLGSAGLNREKVWEYISTLDQFQDPQVRFGMIDMLVRFLSTQGDREADERMEKLLIQAAELNEFAGAPMLANYYFMSYRFDDAMRICEEFLKTKVNATMPILYGESCLLSGLPEMIPPVADIIRQLRGRQSKMIAAYLDALCAFSKGDDAAMQAFLQVAGPTIETPLSSLMRFQLALKQDSPKDILQRLGRIMKGRPFLDFQQRARTAALQYLLEKADSDLLSDPDKLNLCAEVASLIQTPDDDVSFLQRIILMDRFKRKLLTEEELQSALQSFPGDPIFLRVASEFYLMNGKAAHAMDYISEAQSMPDFPDALKPSVNVLYLLALDQLGRKDEAEKEFRTLVEQEKDEKLLSAYYEYCVENGFIDSLKSLSELLASLPEDSAKRAALPFIRAEILLNEGKKEEALALFGKSASKDPRFIFHAALRLAEAGRNDAAFERFLSIRDTYPDKALVNINLSELYAEKGDREHALACARTAWQENQNHLLARYIYGKRLYEEGKYADAIAVLKFPQYKASFPEEMLDVWSKAMRELIKADYYAERYTPTLENAKFLLIYFPDDKFGKDYLERVERIRRHESVGGNM